MDPSSHDAMRFSSSERSNPLDLSLEALLDEDVKQEQSTVQMTMEGEGGRGR